MLQKKINKEEILKLPLYHFGGKIIIGSTEDKIDKALDEITGHAVVGFDTESKPTYRKGEFNHVALMQIATSDRVYLLRIFN